MSGNVQLVAIGAQDSHLTGGKPDVSLFRDNFKKYTNFSMIRRTQNIIGNPKAGGVSTVTIERYGDLLGYMFIVPVDLSSSPPQVDDKSLDDDPYWMAAIDKIELLIGGCVIDTQDSTFTMKIAEDTIANGFSKCSAASNNKYFYPLRFFCCEGWSSSIPLVALQNHDVQIRIYWGTGSYTRSGVPKTINFTTTRFEFNASFVCLDTTERTELSSSKLDMLIFQVQKSVASRDYKQELRFSHPVKYITSAQVVDNVDALMRKTSTIRLEANGVDITETKLAVPYFTCVQSYYHTDYSQGNLTAVFIHPFGLYANRLQPTGTMNFSRLNSFRIYCSNPIDTDVYAVNYNILRVKNGMGALLYSN